MIEDESVDANSTIRRLEAAEARYPLMARVHVLLGNARYHHAALARQGLPQPGRRMSLRFIPSCRPHLHRIERLWELMHKHRTHNKRWRNYPTFAQPALHMLSEDLIKQWRLIRKTLIDNFGFINLNDFWLATRAGHISLNQRVHILYLITLM